jgi:hypothetical protein
MYVCMYVGLHNHAYMYVWSEAIDFYPAKFLSSDTSRSSSVFDRYILGKYESIPKGHDNYCNITSDLCSKTIQDLSCSAVHKSSGNYQLPLPSARLSELRFWKDGKCYSASGLPEERTVSGSSLERSHWMTRGSYFLEGRGTTGRTEEPHCIRTAHLQWVTHRGLAPAAQGTTL